MEKKRIPEKFPCIPKESPPIIFYYEQILDRINYDIDSLNSLKINNHSFQEFLNLQNCYLECLRKDEKDGLLYFKDSPIGNRECELLSAIFLDIMANSNHLLTNKEINFFFCLSYVLDKAKSVEKFPKRQEIHCSILQESNLFGKINQITAKKICDQGRELMSLLEMKFFLKHNHLNETLMQNFRNGKNFQFLGCSFLKNVRCLENEISKFNIPVLWKFKAFLPYIEERGKISDVKFKNPKENYKGMDVSLDQITTKNIYFLAKMHSEFQFFINEKENEEKPFLALNSIVLIKEVKDIAHQIKQRIMEFGFKRIMDMEGADHEQFSNDFISNDEKDEVLKLRNEAIKYGFFNLDFTNIAENPIDNNIFALFPYYTNKITLQKELNEVFEENKIIISIYHIEAGVRSLKNFEKFKKN